MSEKTAFDEEYDKDRNGFLEGQEILTWMVPDNLEAANDEAQHLMAVADADHDEKLSADEIVDNHETFVGSEATDFGEALHDEL